MAYLFHFHSFRRKEIKLCFFWLHDRKAFQSLGILVSEPLMRWGFVDPLLILSMALIDKASYLSVKKSTSSTLGSLSKILSASSPNVVGRATWAWNSAQPSMMYVICLWVGLTTWWLSFSKACITWDLSVFIGMLSLVASGHGTCPKV